MTAREILEAASELARNTGAEATPWDARILLAHAMGGASSLAASRISRAVMEKLMIED